MSEKKTGTKDKKKKGSKPFEFTSELLERIEDMAGKGLTQEQIAHNIGISHYTLSRKKSNNEQLQQAIKRGRAKAIEQMANALFDNGMGGDTTAQIFFLCNRDKENWKHVSKASEDNTSVASELAKLLQELIAKNPG